MCLIFRAGQTFLDQIKVILPCRLIGRTRDSGSCSSGSSPDGAVIKKKGTSFGVLFLDAFLCAKNLRLETQRMSFEAQTRKYLSKEGSPDGVV